MNNNFRVFVLCILGICMVAIWLLTTPKSHKELDKDGVVREYSNEAVGTYQPHVCIDTTHSTCDGKCECDGLGCNEVENHRSWIEIKPRDYQLEIVEDSLLIFDGPRHVGTIPFRDYGEGATPIDSLIMIDND